MPAIIVPGRATKGLRPFGAFRANLDSAQSSGLTAWFPARLDSAQTLRNQFSAVDANATTAQYGAVVVNPSTLQLGVTTTNNTFGDGYSAASSFGLGTSNCTIAGWVYRNDYQSRGCAFYVGTDAGGWGLGFGLNTWDTDGSGVVGLYGGVRWISPGVSASGGANHIALVLNGSGYPTIYLNGLSVYSDSLGAPAALAASTFAIAGYGVVGRSFGAGTVADVRSYARALSAHEVWALYDPATRWDLYWVSGRRIYVDLAATPPASSVYRMTLLGVG